MAFGQVPERIHNRFRKSPPTFKLTVANRPGKETSLTSRRSLRGFRGLTVQGSPHWEFSHDSDEMTQRLIARF
jgi:hypothetical protein